MPVRASRLRHQLPGQAFKLAEDIWSGTLPMYELYLVANPAIVLLHFEGFEGQGGGGGSWLR